MRLAVGVMVLGVVAAVGVRRTGELRGGGVLVRIGEWMVLRQVYGDRKADRLVEELQTCAYDFSTPFNSIVQSLRDSCRQGLPTSQLFNQIFNSYFTLYQSCPELSMDLLEQLEIKEELIQELAKEVNGVVGGEDQDADFDAQMKDFEEVMNGSIEAAHEIRSSSVIKYKTMNRLLQSLAQVRKDMVLDLVLTIDSATSLIHSLTIEICDVLSLNPPSSSYLSMDTSEGLISRDTEGGYVGRIDTLPVTHG